jgi:hypothetical protein
MSQISITGAATGTATFTIESPATSTNRTLILPDNTGTIITQNSTPAFASTIGVGGATAAASGAGITFPATVSASSDANTLDDYEEGTWTPAITASSSNPTVTYNTQQGHYTKIGRQVTVMGIIALASKSGGSGQARISGLPFTTANFSDTAALGILGQMTGFTSAFGDQDGQIIVLRPNINATSCNIFESYESSGSDWAISAIGSNFEARFEATYFV